MNRLARFSGVYDASYLNEVVKRMNRSVPEVGADPEIALVSQGLVEYLWDDRE